MMAFLLHVLTMTGIYSLAVLGLQFSVGRGMVLFIAPTLFFALGAYSSAILTTTYQWPPLPAAAAGVLLAWVTGRFLGMLSWRMKGDHLILATLGLCEIVRSCLNNWDSFTGGSIGIMNIPPLWAGRPAERYPLEYLLTTLLVLTACTLFCWRIGRSPFGRIQAALNGDEAGTAALGRPVGRTKALAIAWGGVWGAIGGSLLAHYSGYIDPSSFTLNEAILIFAMLIVGGLRHPLGAIAGTAAFMLIPEGLRFLGFPSQMGDPLRRVACGVVLLLLVRYRPGALSETARSTAMPGFAELKSEPDKKPLSPVSGEVT